MHDPERQTLIEIYSGHGDSEVYRDWRAVEIADDGSLTCPEPRADYLPACWRAGEIIRERCLAEPLGAEECERRAREARNHAAQAGVAGHRTVPGARVADWLDAGQCRDCQEPAFNYRPKSSVQYIMALRNFDGPEPRSFRFGFLASSDNHSARPGTGYKEVARTEFTETRFGNFVHTPIGDPGDQQPEARSRPIEVKTIEAPFRVWETERQASFFLNGGLAAVHASGRSRDAIWEALERREVYGTSGPRILLWFDLLNAPSGSPAPMGSELAMAESPIFQVRAVGSFAQKPGCSNDATGSMTPERLARLCRGECYNPSDRRRLISRIEVVRIRPQEEASENVAVLIDDPWKTLDCPPDPSGCQVAFSDEQFVGSGRDALYYVRAIEAPSLAVDADPLGCTRDAAGRCVDVDPCFGRPAADDCLAETEERAWSSPIFVDQAGG